MQLYSTNGTKTCRRCMYVSKVKSWIFQFKKIPLVKIKIRLKSYSMYEPDKHLKSKCYLAKVVRWTNKDDHCFISRNGTRLRGSVTSFSCT